MGCVSSTLTYRTRDDRQGRLFFSIFNLSVKCNDILNQTRNLTHTVNANYEEDSYRLCMGRYILFGVKWNFGKMNAAHSARAQQAAWNMLF